MIDNDIYIYAAKGEPAGSHQLLQRAASHWCRRNGTVFPVLDLERTEAGKPYFTYAPQLHFSISHSGGWWLCAMGRQSLGLDVQQVKTVDTCKLARRFFHPAESAYLQAHPEDFFRVWTAKESYVKFTGTGIAGAFRSFSVVENGQLLQHLNGITLRHLPFQEGYPLCLSCQTIGEIHWVEEF